MNGQTAKNEGMTPNLAMAEEFLLRLDETAEFWTFQTFDDNKKRKEGKLARVLNGSLARVGQELIFLARQGAGVFFTVNETDGKGRKLTNMKRIRAVWHEDDNGFDGQFPLPPDIVVLSSPGKFHRYWLVTDEASTCQFRDFMDWLVREYRSDPNAKDLTRVLRLPGFYNQKYDTPFLVQMFD